ncbi:MAG: hypothetical protein ACRDZ4_19000 [Egibacteraceae bacterium]
MCGRVRTCDTLDPDVATAVFDRLAAADGSTASVSTFTRGKVLREIANQPEVTTLPVAELERLADRFVAERATPVLVAARTGAQRCSTLELLALEQRIVDAARARHEEDRHVVGRRVVVAVIDRYADLGRCAAAVGCCRLWAGRGPARRFCWTRSTPRSRPRTCC